MKQEGKIAAVPARGSGAIARRPMRTKRAKSTGTIKRQFFAVIIGLIGGACPAHAATMKEDIDTIQSMFVSAVDVYGPQLERCGRRADREKVFDTVRFAYSAFRRLHSSFPAISPSLDAQLASRFASHCSVVGCSVPMGDECETTRPDGTDSVMSSWEDRAQAIRNRLKKAGLRADDPKKSQSPTVARNTESCPYGAQHYQDAYEKNRRVSDLVCLQKALTRELQ